MGAANSRVIVSGVDVCDQKYPRIAVYLAAYNGVEYLSVQVETILRQINVDVTIFVSVDLSSDGTEAYADYLAATYQRVHVLQHGKTFGSAASNFFRLLLEVDFSEFEYVSFADQDDIWNPDKLSRQVVIAREERAEGVSSNVVAFWPDGIERLVVKSQPLRKMDYLFESAGPGCTFLMTPWLVGEVKKQLLDEVSPARHVALHDWLTYAICRAHGRKWVIDPIPTLMYRQHQSNVIGANIGLRAKLARISKVRQHWYRNEILKISTVCTRISSDKEIKKIVVLLSQYGFIPRVKLLAYVKEARRSFWDRAMLALAIMSGIF